MNRGKTTAGSTAGSFSAKSGATSRVSVPLDGPDAGGEVKSFPRGWMHLNAAGELHRDPADGPAVQHNDGVAAGGSEEYWVNGLMHRDGGPASVWDGGVGNGGGEEWYQNDRLHRDPAAGPARQENGGAARGGSDEFYVGGRRHRPVADGPAYIWGGGSANGGGEQYWENGVQIVPWS